MSVLEPEKELRFTRTGQALFFGILAGALFTAGCILLVTAGTVQLAEGSLEELPYLWWSAFFPVGLALGLFVLAWRCLKHPYLLLSPVGVEIFPFWKPVQNYRLLAWGRIASLEVPSEKTLILHFDEKKSGGVVLSLRPIHKEGRALLKRALQGVLEQRSKNETKA